ncbi:hypothetical protein BEN47_15735 [Hymenobacter lapidarius]|uniref:Secretion system C-terminal sorting domain-containing protein n=1 Tax=Hymenobacter lapidarius TaxID=1908237 RepID=A0A1G1T225_9BACT|nr:T9SS type A sorting domain-containing protein [Hymenobacter lapidarius]OGX84911.1 hypothetical protein BEN47_15735 [Hymenobacter lapidarius]
MNARVFGGLYALVGVGATASVSLSSATGVFTNLAPGTYNLSVTLNGCTSTALEITINAAPGAPAQPQVTIVQPTSVLATGSLTVTAALTGGTYTLVGINATLTSSIGTFTGLAPGTYSLSVTLNGCTSTALEIIINAPGAPVLAIPIAVVVQPTCLAATGSLTVTAPLSGGVYTLVGVGATLTSATGVFTGLAPGAYSLRVTLNGSTSAALAVTINAALNTLSITNAAVTSASCAATGSITVTATGGTGAYSYQLNNGSFGTSNVFTGLASGTYTVTVQDASGCSATRTNVTILGGSSSLVLTLSSLVNATCITSTGSATLAASGGTMPYSYTLTSGSRVLTNTTGVFSSLAAGTYSVLVTDASGCTATCSTLQLVIDAAPNAPAQPAVTVVQPASCSVATGSVSVTLPLAGGSYTLVGAGVSLTSTTGVFDGLAPGTYSLSAILNGCASPALAVTINAAPGAPAQPVAVIVQPTAAGAAGSVTVTSPLSGGTYTLVGAGVALTSATGTFTNLAPGTYSLSVSVNGCVSAALAVTINAAPNAPALPVAVIVQPTAVVASGSLTVTAPLSGGTYTLVRAGVSLTSTTGVFTGLAPGAYSLSVSVNGCVSAALAVTINAAPGAPVLAPPVAGVVQPTCLVATGSLTVTAALSGGTYTLAGAGVSLTSATGVFTGLAPGTYSLSVSVNGLVSAALAVTINAAPAAPAQPIVAVVQPTSVLATGSVTVTSLLSGGVYALVGVGATAGVSLTSSIGVFTGLTPGAYSLSVSVSGCVSAALAVTINAAPIAPALPVAVVVQPTCLVATGSLTVTAALSGGTYTLVGAGVSLTSATGVFTGLAPGTYSLSVSVNGLVSAALAVTINSTPAVISLTSTVTAAACFGTATGQVQFQAVGGTAPYTFTLDGRLSNGSGLFTSLAAGVHVVLVRDANGCGAAASSVTITQPAVGLSVLFSAVVNACAGTTGQVSASATGGTAPYTYQLRLGAAGTVVATSPAVTSGFTFTGLGANTYRLFVLDARGCETEAVAQLLITNACLKLTLLEVYPNPFSGRATVEFQVPEGEQYSLALYDILGRLVRRVSEGVGEANRIYQLPIGDNLAEGLYEVRLISNGTTKTVRVHAQ